MRVYSPNGAEDRRKHRAILLIAHPGHELRVHRWLESTVPEVWVLTDGSGRTHRSRVDSTTRVLDATGAMPGPVYARFSDADLYDAVLSFDHGQFTDLVDQLATALMRDDIDCIAGDAQEGYNPAHDVCRLVINAAIRLVQRRTTKRIANYDFTLMAAPDDCPTELRSQSLWFNLDDAAFTRKISAARNYPELRAEVEAALKGAGHETFRHHSDLVERARSTFGVTDASNFRVECLRPINAQCASTKSHNGDVPFYEAYGEKQVRAGHYTRVLRFHEHIVPLVAALDSHVERNS
ncbi:MAG TPA: hypothetical protein VIG25_05530 [Pyrinomonadaceae bacterium]